MGTSYSPWLANLTLFAFALEYFSSERLQLTPRENNDKSAKGKCIGNMVFCTRYVDDL